MEEEAIYKVYNDGPGSLLLDLPAGSIRGDSLVGDRSGFAHRGRLICGLPLGEKVLVPGKDCYIELEHAPALDRMGETLTMMVHVFPVGPGEHLMDIFSKGDNHVLQVSGNRELTFFAGGWGRGDCTVPLPADWAGHWHYIAGVCTGSQLQVYIDGELKGVSDVNERVNLSVDDKWVLGRNEEFPGQRAFNGRIDKAMVFAEALTAEQIKTLCKD